MNKEEFEVWKKQKEEDFEVEIEKLRNDFAKRGLAQSGMRDKTEASLRTKYDSEIEMERLRMEAEEKAKKQWFPNGNWRPFLLSAIVSILVGVIVYFLASIS